MSRDFTIVLFAIFQSSNDETEQINPRTRHFCHKLEIVTEADTIFMPIEADITTCDEHRIMFRGNLEAGKGQTVRILSVRPASTRDMVTKQGYVLNQNKYNKNDFMEN